MLLEFRIAEATLCCCCDVRNDSVPNESNHVMRGSRWMGSPFTGKGRGLIDMSSSGSSRVHEKRVTRRWRITRISMRANSLPGHILAPPPNGTNVYGPGPAPSKRDGSNFSGSGKYFAFRFVECTVQNICVCRKNFKHKTQWHDGSDQKRLG